MGGVAAFLADELAALGVDLGVDDLEVFLVDDEVVRGDGAGDDRLAEPVDGVDGDLGGVVAARVDHEHDAGALRLHHVLDDDGDTDFELAVAALGAVEDGAGLEEGGPALLDGAEDVGLALDVEVGALLSGEGGLGHVFGGGGAADGDGQALHLAVSAGDRLGGVGGHVRADDQALDLVGDLVQAARCR